MYQSEMLFEKALQFIPGGVNSPVRAFKSVGGTPIFIDRADGPYLWDEDGNQYIDYVCSWGPMILGHNHPKVLEAVEHTVKKGLSFGAATKLEVELAEKICDIVPSIEQVRMVNSGTEATMSAIRLARGYTKRDKIIKFNGCYHGHNDSLLVKAGSGVLTFGIPGTPGIPESITTHTLSANYNDLDSVKALFEHYPDDIAAVIIEPIAANMNCIPPNPGFLAGLRELCNQYNSVLIFDEVITGFRVSKGGAQEFYNVIPDMTTLGKIIGGGMPVGAFGGKKDIMQHIAPAGDVYQAGTLSGNPIAMSAGIATLNEIVQPGFYETLEKQTSKLLHGIRDLSSEAEIPLQTTQINSLFGLFFTEKQNIQTFDDVAQCNIDQFKQFFHYMLKEGVYLAPSAFESAFVSTAHNDTIIEKTLEAVKHSLMKLAINKETIAI